MVLEQLTRDINLGMDNREFYHLARKAWAKPKERNYLLILNWKSTNLALSIEKKYYFVKMSLRKKARDIE